MENSKKNFVYTSQYLSNDEVYQLLNNLAQDSKKMYTIRIQSKNREFIHYLKSKLTSEKKKPAKQSSSSTLSLTNYQKIREEIQERGLPLQMIINFESELLLKAFLFQYKSNLIDMMKEYDLRLIRQMDKLKVFSLNPISKLFLSEILIMKRNFTIKWFKNKELWMKCKYSLLIKDAMKAKNIHAYEKKGSCDLVLMHGEADCSEVLTQFAVSYSYEAVYLLFNDLKLPYKICQCLFNLVLKSVDSLINKIRYYYEIPIELNRQKMAVIIHTKDPIFSKEPIEETQNFLKNIIITGYSSNNVTEELQHFQVVKLKNKRSFTYDKFACTLFQCWNKTKQICPNDVSIIYSIMLENIKLDSFKFRIYLRDRGLNAKHRESILEMIEKYKLDCINYASVLDNETNVIEIKLRNFSNKVQQRKKQQLLLFLQELITGSPQITSQNTTTQNQEIQKCMSPNQVQSEHKEPQPARQALHPKISNNQQNPPPMQEKSIVISLKQLKLQKFGKRSPNLQKILYNQFNAKCLIRSNLSNQLLEKINSEKLQLIPCREMGTKTEKIQLCVLTQKQKFGFVLEHGPSQIGEWLYKGELIAWL